MQRPDRPGEDSLLAPFQPLPLSLKRLPVAPLLPARPRHRLRLTLLELPQEPLDLFPPAILVLQRSPGVADGRGPAEQRDRDDARHAEDGGDWR